MKLERQAARVHHMRCPRCSHGYWIRARDIANAIPRGEPVDELVSLLDAPTVGVLRKAGVTTLVELEEQAAANTLAELEGVGPGREASIRRALDKKKRVAQSVA